MPLASEVTTTQEPDAAGPVPRLRSRVRTNAGVERLRRRLEKLDLLRLVEAIDRATPNWFWSGTGQGYEILWRDTTTFVDLLPLARL
jgi:hypothetical protein